MSWVGTWSATVLAGLLIGLASSAHCAGMCGVFALRAGGGPRAGLRMALYLCGKAFTYVFLGALAGLAGARVVDAVSGAAPWIAVAVALALVVAALNMLLPARAVGAPGTLLGRLLAPAFRAAHGAEAAGGPFALGAVTGLLPCGVVYVAAAQGAATGSPLGGAVLMAAFGAGTMPVLAAVGLFGGRLLRRFGPARLRLVGGCVLLAAAAVGTGRAALAFHAAATGGPPCCHSVRTAD